MKTTTKMSDEELLKLREEGISVRELSLMTKWDFIDIKKLLEANGIEIALEELDGRSFVDHYIPTPSTIATEAKTLKDRNIRRLVQSKTDNKKSNSGINRVRSSATRRYKHPSE